MENIDLNTVAVGDKLAIMYTDPSTYQLRDRQHTDVDLPRFIMLTVKRLNERTVTCSQDDNTRGYDVPLLREPTNSVIIGSSNASRTLPYYAVRGTVIRGDDPRIAYTRAEIKRRKNEQVVQQQIRHYEGLRRDAAASYLGDVLAPLTGSLSDPVDFADLKSKINDAFEVLIAEDVRIFRYTYPDGQAFIEAVRPGDDPLERALETFTVFHDRDDFDLNRLTQIAGPATAIESD